MKKLILKSILFISIPIVLAYIITFIRLQDANFFLDKKMNAYEVYYAIFKSKKKANAKIVILGDSVSRQLFDSYDNDPNFYSMATNQSVGIAGNYFLLYNYLLNNDVPDKVYFICTPFMFHNNLDDHYTYQNFLKPFYNEEYEMHFSDNLLTQIKANPLYFLSNNYVIKSLNWIPEYHNLDNGHKISKVSVDYLRKIIELSKKKKFELIFYPAPISKEKNKDFVLLNKKELNQFENVSLNNFYKTVSVYDNAIFFPDRIHLFEGLKKLKNEYHNNLLK